MKKILFIALSFIVLLSLAACNDKEKTAEKSSNTVTESNNTETAIPENTVNDEQVDVRSGDALTVDKTFKQYCQNTYGETVEEITTNSIRLYGKEHIANDESLKKYDIKDGDIVFEINYNLKIKEGFNDMNSFTAGSGKIDGQWIKEKSNVGIVRNNGEAGYSIDALGTAF